MVPFLGHRLWKSLLMPDTCASGVGVIGLLFVQPETMFAKVAMSGHWFQVSPLASAHRSINQPFFALSLTLPLSHTLPLSLFLTQLDSHYSQSFWRRPFN